ncbi:hypothetical protein SUSAZ_10410 [Sulfolobus acidocaldarius SUSAZ]|nr:hypothetical protein SUSAZ_10410 [Sulfolobus acidocaldarius SUSAZ]
MDKPVEITPDGKVVRKSYSSVKKGIDWNSYPMRLWAKSNELFWSPLQFKELIQQDKQDWETMSESEREISEYIATAFSAGEEAVSRYLAELVIALDELGYTEEVLFLNQFQQEETRHTDAFRRWMDSIGMDKDTEKWTTEVNPSYYELFYVALPSAAYGVKANPSPESILRFTATYMFSIEGIAAETGFYFWRTMWERGRHLKGIYEIVKRVAADESRHLAFGTYLTTMLIGEDQSLYDKFLEYFNYAGGLAVRLIGTIVEQQVNKWEPYKEKWGRYFEWVYKENGLGSLVDYAAKMVQHRLFYVNRLRNANREKLRYMPLNEAAPVIENFDTVEKYLTPQYDPE